MTDNYFCYFEDKFLRIKEAKVSIMTNALQYGTGVFGGIRGYYIPKKGYLAVFRLFDHYRRFLNSLKILGVGLKYSQKELESITVKLLKMNQPKTDVYLRPFAYASSLNISPNLNTDRVFGFSLHMIPLGDYLPVNKGLSVCVSSWRRISDNAIPPRAKISGGYINSALARKEADDRGFDEAIFLTSTGNVSEGSAENIFLVRNNSLVTPSKDSDILEGITRRTIIQFARDLKIPVEERTVDRSELYQADEAFFSGTGVQTAWISQIDGRMIGNGKRGPITEKILNLFFRTVKGENKKYLNWCTKIKI